MSTDLFSPLVSIIIPTYNHAQFLESAIDSVRAQTVENWEVIVVNNFSQDNTTELVSSYKDKRIRLVNFANNGNIASSRNKGIELTNAPYVAFLDSDDLWYPEKLSRCLHLLQQGYDLVCNSEAWVKQGSERRVVHYGPQARASYKSLLLEGNCLSTSAVVVRRELLVCAGGFSTQQEFITAEDYELWLKLARLGAKFGFLREVLGEYLIHEGNQSRAALRNMNAVMAVFHHHRVFVDGQSYEKSLIRREAIIQYSGARGLQLNGQHHEAWFYFINAIRLYPWVFRFYIAMTLNLFRLRY